MPWRLRQNFRLQKSMVLGRIPWLFRMCGPKKVPGLVNIPKNYGKSPCFMGKLTISTGPFSIAMCMFTRGYLSYPLVSSHMDSLKIQWKLFFWNNFYNHLWMVYPLVSSNMGIWWDMADSTIKKKCTKDGDISWGFIHNLMGIMVIMAIEHTL